MSTAAELDYATKHLLVLGADLLIRYSPYTGKWYATLAGVEVSDGYTMTSYTEHCDSPTDAVCELFLRLTDDERGIPYVELGDKRIVVNKTTREAYCWNGVAFFRVKESERSSR